MTVVFLRKILGIGRFFLFFFRRQPYLCDVEKKGEKRLSRSRGSGLTGLGVRS